MLVPAIDLVDIYQVYCNLLRVEARAHNGTFARVRDLLVAPEASPRNAAPDNLSSAPVVAFLLAAALAKSI